MDKQKYNNYPLAISQILGLIEANDIAIPVYHGVCPSDTKD